MTAKHLRKLGTLACLPLCSIPCCFNNSLYLWMQVNCVHKQGYLVFQVFPNLCNHFHDRIMPVLLFFGLYVQRFLWILIFLDDDSKMLFLYQIQNKIFFMQRVLVKPFTFSFCIVNKYEFMTFKNHSVFIFILTASQLLLEFGF